MRIAFMFRGELCYTDTRLSETPMNAIVRSVSRRVAAPVEIYWTERGVGRYGGSQDLYTVKWFDAATKTYQEAEMVY